MTVELITRGEKTWRILYGYGRIQKIRTLFQKSLPERVKRAIVANPDVDSKQIWDDLSVEERVAYDEVTGPAVAKIVLQEATDWDKSKMTVDEYVDGEMPSDVGNEILLRVGKAVQDTVLGTDEKKT